MYCYIELKLSYLKNLIFLSIRVTLLFELKALKKGQGFFSLHKKILKTS